MEEKGLNVRTILRSRKGKGGVPRIDLLLVLPVPRSRHTK